ncbi:MAG: SDR family oxidoreductase [Acidimicrobiales bacterium]|nr:SDR family oxidoreductase [Acidimicrobiales bacterium]
MTQRRLTSLVTGANTGIGFITARELARRGDRVIVACRSEAKASRAIAELTAATGSPDIEFLELDLGDLEAVRSSANKLLKRGEPIDILVANAGLAGQRGQTAQGFELAFGTNHLGHFLFVTELLELIRSAYQPARVVVVSSEAHYKPDSIPWEDLTKPTKSVTGLAEYGVSKLANLLFAQELARREPEMFVGALHPGVIASDVWRSVPWPIRPIMTRFMKGTEQGAKPSLKLAMSDEVLSHSGSFWFEEKLKEPNRVATPDLAEELWQRSEQWVSK